MSEKPVAKATPASTSEASSPKRQRKGPISFLSGSLTSFGFGWLALQLAQRIVGYYAEHPPPLRRALCPEHRGVHEDADRGDELPGHLHLCFRGLGAVFHVPAQLDAGLERSGANSLAWAGGTCCSMTAHDLQLLVLLLSPGMLLSVLLLLTFAAGG